MVGPCELARMPRGADLRMLNFVGIGEFDESCLEALVSRSCPFSHMDIWCGGRRSQIRQNSCMSPGLPRETRMYLPMEG